MTLSLSATNESGQSRADDTVLRAAARWQRARAETLLRYAQSEEITLFGTVDGGRAAPEKAHRELEDGIDWLGRLEPTTVRDAREMLNVVLAVLAHRETDSDPESSRLANLPILPILRNIPNAMEFNCNAQLGSWPKGDAA